MGGLRKHHPEGEEGKVTVKGEESERRLKCLGDGTQQHGRESLGQRILKGSSGLASYQ